MQSQARPARLCSRPYRTLARSFAREHQAPAPRPYHQESLMTVLTHARSRHRRWLASLAGLAALILPVSLLTTAAASAAQHSAAPASRCTAAYLTSALHLSQVTVDSAAPDTSGSYTPPGTTPL